MEKKYLKEVVAGGNLALFPKLVSAEGISLRDTKALTEYLKTFDFYKDFATYTQLKQAELGAEAAEAEEAVQTGEVGRPLLPDSEITSDATSVSRETGTNTAENRA